MVAIFLFAYQEVTQALPDFSPFEVCYTHQVRGPWDVLRETWEGPGKSQDMNVVSYVLSVREQLMKSTATTREKLLQAQAN